MNRSMFTKNIRWRLTACAFLVAVNISLVTTLVRAQDRSPAFISVGDARLDASRIKPGKITFKMILVNNDQENEMGTLIDEISLTQAQGKPAFLRVETIQIPSSTLIDKSIFFRETLAPLSLRSESAKREMTLDFTGTSVKGSLRENGGEPKAIDVRLDAPLFDSTILDLVVQALPLCEGYSARLPFFLHEAGGKVSVDIRVNGRETIKTSQMAGVETWVVETTRGGRKHTFWFAEGSHELIRQSTSPRPGVEIRMVRQ